MQMRWNEMKSAAIEIKKEFERDLIIRRYQKWLEGELPWEDRFFDSVAKARIHMLTMWRAAAKRTLDLVAGSAATVIFAPVMAIVALAIKLDSKGPVFYKQTRVGYRGHQFQIIKFRTMLTDAEARTGPVWAKEDDPRITRLGRFLRKSHLDELPQLFNVVHGEMSLVGPRPERPYFVEEFKKIIPNYEKRLVAKPGITGVAQVKQRYDETLEDVKRKVRYDLFYIKKMCPLLDVKVMALTVGEVLFRQGR